jgi:hypothetical protein
MIKPVAFTVDRKENYRQSMGVRPLWLCKPTRGEKEVLMTSPNKK